MKVLTYLKDLPVKLLNENQSIISLEGATLYIDEESNRYTYVCFNNHYRKPFFALILELGQYDVGGHLIKRENYYVPNCYGAKGKVVLEKPITIDKECEGMEIKINLALYGSKILANEMFVPSNTVNFEFPRLANNEPLEPTGNAGAFPGDNNAPYRETIAISDVDRKPLETASNETNEVVKEQQEVVKPVVNQNAPIVTKDKKKKNLFTRKIFPIIVGVVVVVIALVVYLFIKAQLPPTRYWG